MKCYGLCVAEAIAQRQLRNDNGEIMRRVENGESFVVDVDALDFGDLQDRAPIVSAITIGELAFGADLGADRDGRRARLRRILDEYEVLPFGIEEAEFYGVLATLVRAAGRNPRPRLLDLQIAATAAAARVPLMTTTRTISSGSARSSTWWRCSAGPDGGQLTLWSTA